MSEWGGYAKYFINKWCPLAGGSWGTLQYSCHPLSSCTSFIMVHLSWNEPPVLLIRGILHSYWLPILHGPRVLCLVLWRRWSGVKKGRKPLCIQRSRMQTVVYLARRIAFIYGMATHVHSGSPWAPTSFLQLPVWWAEAGEAFLLSDVLSFVFLLLNQGRRRKLFCVF